MSTTITTLTALKHLARLTAPQGMPQTATLTGGSTSTVVVSGHAYTSWSANQFDGVFVYMDSTTDGLAPQGEERQITKAGFAGASGTYTVAPAFSVAPADGDTAVWLYGGHKRLDIINAINDILANLYIDAYLPIGPNITDIDMETSGVASWSSVSAPATKAKITTASRVITGYQALNVVVNSATEGVQGPTFDVTPSETILFSVAGIGSIGGWTVRLVDMTSGSAVVLVTGTAVTDLAPTEWRYQYTVASGVYRMAIQVIGNGTTDDFALSWCMPVFRNREFVFPQASLQDTSKIEGIYYLPRGRSASTADAYSALTENLEPWPYYTPLKDWRAANSFRIPVDKPMYPLFVKFRRQHPTVSLDTDVIYAPEELIVAGALWKLTGDAKIALRYNHMLRAFNGVPNGIKISGVPRVRVSQG